MEGMGQNETQAGRHNETSGHVIKIHMRGKRELDGHLLYAWRQNET
jgi:hypothetical protein